MLANAMLYLGEIRKAFLEVWYEPRYQYYFGSDNRWLFGGDLENAPLYRGFASLDNKGRLLGYIGYCIESDVRLVTNFRAVNFSDDRTTFARDLHTAIDDVFVKFGIETMEFAVVRGNPIERKYDRLVKRVGGRVVGVRHARATDLAGNTCDDKLYEITRAGYMASRRKRANALAPIAR